MDEGAPPYSVRLDALEAAVRERTDLEPRLGIVLGSGLGSLAEAMEQVTAIPFDDLPGWPAASAPGHAGRLLLGRLEDVPVSACRVACTCTRATARGWWWSRSS